MNLSLSPDYTGWLSNYDSFDNVADFGTSDYEVSSEPVDTINDNSETIDSSTNNSWLRDMGEVSGGILAGYGYGARSTIPATVRATGQRESGLLGSGTASVTPNNQAVNAREQATAQKQAAGMHYSSKEFLIPLAGLAALIFLV